MREIRRQFLRVHPSYREYKRYCRIGNTFKLTVLQKRRIEILQNPTSTLFCFFFFLISLLDLVFDRKKTNTEIRYCFFFRFTRLASYYPLQHPLLYRNYIKYIVGFEFFFLFFGSQCRLAFVRCRYKQFNN